MIKEKTEDSPSLISAIKEEDALVPSSATKAIEEEEAKEGDGDPPSSTAMIK